MNITTSNNSIIHYSSFSIAQNETVNFILPSADSFSLNRVIGNEQTEILGRLTSIGNLVLINPNGLFFGPQATVRVGGLIASTRDINNQDFLRGVYQFGTSGGPYSSVVNQGLIEAREKGFVALVGSSVQNSGTITAPLGSVALASGDVVTVGINPTNTISIGIDRETSAQVLDSGGNPISDQITQTGELNAQYVTLNAQSAKDLFHHAVNVEGVIRADTLVEGEDGVIRIVGDGPVRVAAQSLSAAQGEVLIQSDEGIEITGNTKTQGNTTFESKGNIEVKADLTTDSGNLVLKADSDLDGIGSFLQAAGTTIRTYGRPGGSPLYGFGDITIQASGESTLANIISAGSLYLKQAGAPVTYTVHPDSRFAIHDSLLISEGVTLSSPNVLIGDLDSTVRGNDIEVGKDWVNRGVFIAGTSTVRLTGGQDASVYGNNTFHDFIVIEPNKTVTFEAGATQEITGTLTLQGAYGKLILLRSTRSGFTWNLNPTGTTQLS
ncbi:MAG: filamentous hemagglutinin N-terminal domain-containing protein, partial [Candidatus Omnitrophica bacterium]|nr:filamentous hemagglutinin N-terminal domain-containing protein [Candidatus Omnitrophota bacterium]